MTPLATIDWDALLTVVWASLLAGIGVTAAFGFAILGGTRAVELGRAGRSAEATVYGVLGVLGIATVLGAVAYGIVILAE
jgi:hypothetical protein